MTAAVCPAAALALLFGALLAPGWVSLRRGVRDFCLESFVAAFVAAPGASASSPAETSVTCARIAAALVFVSGVRTSDLLDVCSRMPEFF